MFYSRWQDCRAGEGNSTNGSKIVSDKEKSSFTFLISAEAFMRHLITRKILEKVAELITQ